MNHEERSKEKSLLLRILGASLVVSFILNMVFITMYIELHDEVVWHMYKDHIEQKGAVYFGNAYRFTK